MTQVIQQVNLNLIPQVFGANSVLVPCSQYDKTYRVIQFNVYNGRELYSIPSTCTVIIRGTKKDNTGFEYNCEFSGSQVIFPLEPQITVLSGKVPAELRIVIGEELIGSANFLFMVEPSPLTDDTIISETQLPLLEEALQAAAEAEQSRILAEAAKDSAEDYAMSAGESSQSASQSAVNASVSEANALTSEQNAKASEQNAKESEDLAQGYSQDAQGYASNASDSATQAEASAVRAEEATESAEDYANEAKGYAEQSLASAQNSAQSASNALTHENNARQSETNAQAYASNASQSASNASASATQAQTYASNASTSATASANSASQASTSASNASTSATNSANSATASANSATASANSATSAQNSATSAEESATEAQNILDNIDSLIEHKADDDGIYPNMSVGSAEKLLTSETIDDEFTYQTLKHDGYARINSIKGNTIVWNQLVDTDTSSVTLTSGHKFITKVNGAYSLVDGTGQSLSVTGGTDEVFDLTKMGLDSLTADQFRSLYPLNYYQYNSGELLSFNGTGIKTVGKNRIALPVVAYNTLYNAPMSEYFFIEKGAYTLSYTANVTNRFLIKMVDAGGNYLSDDAHKPSVLTYWNASYQGWILGSDRAGGHWEFPITIAEDCYIRITRSFTNPDTIVFTDTQLELGSTATSYVPYSTNTLELPIQEHFPTGMKKAGNVYDELTEKKAITRIGSVDLGTSTWAISSSPSASGGKVFWTRPINLKPRERYTPNNVVCVPYATASDNVWFIASMQDKTVYVNTNVLYIADDSYADAQEFKQAMQGVILYYELNEPAEVDIDIDLTYMIVSGGTEQLLPINSSVPVTSPLSRNVSFFYDSNVVSNLLTLLSSVAQVETSPTTHAYAVGDYLMYNYQLYRVTSAIAVGGTLTVGTNIVATTLVAIINS